MRRFNDPHTISGDATAHWPVGRIEQQDRSRSSVRAPPPRVARSTTDIAAVSPTASRNDNGTTHNVETSERGRALSSSHATLSELLAGQKIAESSRRRLALDGALSNYRYPHFTTTLVPPLNALFPPWLASNIHHPPDIGRYFTSISQAQQQYPINNMDPGLLTSASLTHPATVHYQTVGLPATSINSLAEVASMGIASAPSQIPRTLHASLLQHRIGALLRLPTQAIDPYLVHQYHTGDINNLPLGVHPQQQQSLAAGYDELQPRASSRSTSSSVSSQLLFHNNSNRARSSESVTGGVESFPMVLHRALSDLELVEGGTAIATFLPNGKSFRIRNQFLFEKRVLPVFFPKMKSFASLQRQLNLYDFKRIEGIGVDRGAYRHDLFVRELPAQSSRMKRSKIKGRPPRGAARRDRAQSNGTEETAAPDNDEALDNKVGASL